MNLPAIVLGLLIASAAGLLYHLVRGGPLARMALYVASAWIAFGAGHAVGDWLGLSLLRLGALNLFPALLATLLALLLTDALAPPAKKAGDHQRREPPFAAGE